MYEVQDKPDEKATLKNGAEVTPLVTLKNEYGGISHIIEDDHCYVLINGSDDRPFGMSAWWYPEAIEALKELPLPKPA